MGEKQTQFVARVRTALKSRFPHAADWAGGQGAANTVALPRKASLRRPGPSRSGERFERADVRCNVGNSTIVVEYDSGGIATHNLVKYWPYLRGEMSSSPSSAIILCHFSSWVTYGSYRDLWDWLAGQMMRDPTLKVRFAARQFDHWDADLVKGDQSIAECLDWVESEVK